YADSKRTTARKIRGEAQTAYGSTSRGSRRRSRSSQGTGLRGEPAVAIDGNRVAHRVEEREERHSERLAAIHGRVRPWLRGCRGSSVGMVYAAAVTWAIAGGDDADTAPLLLYADASGTRAFVRA